MAPVGSEEALQGLSPRDIADRRKAYDPYRWADTYTVEGRITLNYTFTGTVQRDFRQPVFFIIQTSLGH